MAKSEASRLKVAIELGRLRLDPRARDNLKTGDLIALEQSVEEPVDVFADGMLVARGTIVVVEDRFCVRITDLVAHVNALA